MDLKGKKIADFAANESSALIGKGAFIKYVCTEGEGSRPKCVSNKGRLREFSITNLAKMRARGGRGSKIPKIILANLMDGP